jgi:GT2 family glycosyltransferase
MSDIPKVAIIVLNYNGDKCLSSCLHSLEKLEYSNKEIIVVDNKSTDSSFSSAQKLYPHFSYIQNEKNEGFAKGMNIGMRIAFSRGAKWCLLFNYDAEIDAQALTELVLVAEKYPHAGLLSPIIFQKGDKQVWFAKGKIDYFRMRAVHTKPSREEFLSDAYSSEYLTGCALFVKKALVDAIGYLDEQLFLYYEDADYCVRARQAGFESLVVSKALVWHSEESKTNPRKTYFLVYSGLLFFRKHTPCILRPYIALYGTIRRVKNLFDRLFCKNDTVESVYRAYKQFFHEY